MQESARAVLRTSAGLVLLMHARGSKGDLWLTPGGRIRPGERREEAATREVWEETGHRCAISSILLWVRTGTYVAGGKITPEREYFFLMPTEHFEPSDAAMEEPERMRHRGFRWWTVSEIETSAEAFVPRSLGALLRSLDAERPPASPIPVIE